MNIHVVCPRNGEPQPCRRTRIDRGQVVPEPCGEQHVHRVEALVPDDAMYKPTCLTHRVPLQPVAQEWPE